MKPRRIGFLVVALLLLGGSFWWYYRVPTPNPNVQKVQHFPTKKKETSVKETLPKSLYESWKGGPSQDLSDPRWQEVHRRDKLDKSWQWKMPINFYGKVVDENEQPVEDAHIKLDWNDQSARGTSYSETVSDANGFFSLTGVEGKILGVRPEKESYYTSLEQNRFVFEYAAFWEEKSYHEPDPDKPVIFHLRKKGEAEPLIKRYAQISLPRNGSVVRFDLFEGKQSQAGQLELQAWCSEKDAEGKYDWRLIIQVPSGGIKDTKEEFAFSAPESGYAPTLEINMLRNLGKDWKSSVEQQAYVAFGNPVQYTRINFRMTGLGENFYMDCWVNPSGSRNLEYDKEKEIKPERIAAVGLEKAIEEASQSRKSSGLNDKLEMTNDK